MNAIKLLRSQLKSAHDTMEATMNDVDDVSAHFTKIGKALPVGAAYAHAIIGEDVVVANMLAHTTPLSVNNTKTGLSEPMPSFAQWEKHDAWARSVKVDLPLLKEFAKKVYHSTDRYLVKLKEEDLDREIEVPGMGKHPLEFFITNFVILHLANLTGEISAAKGIQNLKGYPF